MGGPRSPQLLSNVVVVLLVAAACLSTAGAADVVAFTIARSGTQHRSVSLDNVRCKFSYTTSPGGGTAPGGAAAAAGAASRKQLTPEAVLRELKGRCVKKKDDFWEYSLCFEGDVKQSHGSEVFQLGHFSRTSGTQQFYTGGTGCGSARGNPRTSDVTFTCGQQLALTSVEEVATCKYALAVSVPGACGINAFKQTVTRGGGSVKSAARDDDPEPWVLEVMKTVGGDYLCRAYSVIDIKSGGAVGNVPTLAFNSWELSVSQQGGDEALRLVAADARLSDRTVIPGQYGVTQPTNAREPVVVSSGSPDGAGALGFVTAEVAPPVNRA